MARITAQPISQVGAVPALVVYLVALFGIPSVLIVGPLGSAGTPAQIIGIGMFGWWIVSRFVPRRTPIRTNPIKWLIAVFAIAILLSYVFGMSRPITYTIEVNSADRSLLSLAAWSGVVLIFADGIGTRARLDTVLKVVAGGATVVAFIGILQFIFRIDIAHFIRIPGLKENQSFGGVISRSKYNRVQGTTSHPIEFGVVMSSTLPLVIHYARFAATSVQRRRWAVAVGIVAITLPMSVARSAALGGLIAFAVLFFTWPAKTRVRSLLGLIIGAMAMSVVVPGLLGTIRGLFLNASGDPSTQGRTADYGTVQHYFEMHPFFGRGIGTFIPDLYRTLDNAYLGYLIEVGLFGFLSLLVLFIGSIVVAANVRRASKSDSVRDLAQSLIAGIAVLAVNCATFDAFGFAMCAGIIFVLIGAVAALWRIESKRGPLSAPHAPRWRGVDRLGAGVLVVLFGLTAVFVKQAVPEYRDYSTLILNPPTTPGQIAFQNTASVTYTASVLRDIMNNQDTRNGLKQQGASSYEVAFKDGSLESGTDVVGILSSTLYVKTAGSTAPVTQKAMTAVVAEMRSRLINLQATVGLVTTQMIGIQQLQDTGPIPVKGRKSRALLGLVILASVVSVAYFQIVRRRRANDARYLEELEEQLETAHPRPRAVVLQ